MCGISGIFDPVRPLGPEARAACARMVSAMAYRGPDAEGLHAEEHAVLGHRRLSIIDLSTGQQPMHGDDGRLTIVFNGEIYNYRDLRGELAAAGYPFRTRSDTEVILAAYTVWGRACLERLKGMFAFALVDRKHNLLLAARDPIGKKPLYYRLRNGVLHFASDMAALRAGGAAGGPLSETGLSLYFGLGYIPAPHTIYEGVRKLPAGHAFCHSARGWEEWSYWDIPLGRRIAGAEASLTERLGELLDGAVARRLVSEVPLGAFLSGGIDSNLVVSSMVRASADRVRTFTAGFGERARMTGVRDEREVAAMAAAAYGTAHEEITLGAAAGELLPTLAARLGEPLADPSIIPTFLVCQAARRRVTVVLTGDGGDEPFGGYSFRYLPHLAENRVRKAVPAALLSPVSGALAKVWPRSARLPRALRLNTIFRNLAVSPLEAFFLDQSPLPADASVFRRGRDWALDPALDAMRALYDRTAGADDLDRLLYVDARLYMAENVLVKADRMSMAASVELRAPLLDESVVSFAFGLPREMKIRGLECKYLLRRLAEKRVAPGLSDMPKTGFSFPVDHYLRKVWREDFERRVLEGDSVLDAGLDRGRVRVLWDGFLAGRNTHLAFLWSTYILAQWHQEFHLREPAAPAGELRAATAGGAA